MDQASALLGQVGGIFADREKQLQKAEGELRQKAEALKKEKEMMAKLPVADNDILTLNVGGTILVTKRATLIQAEGSALAARLSGNWEQCLDHDDQGRIFLDFDPDLFTHILSYLRLRAMLSSSDGKVPYPEIKQHKQQGFTKLVNYLALDDYMGCTVAQTHLPSGALHFAAAHPDIQLEEQMATASTGRGSHDKSISVGPVVGNVCYMKCKVHALYHWIFFGIAAGVDVTAGGTHQRHCRHVSSHGWSSNGQQWVCGRHSNDGLKFAAADWVLLKADFGNNKLSIRSSRVSIPVVVSLTMPPELRSRAFFHVVLFIPGDKVELLPVTAEDQLLLP